MPESQEGTLINLCTNFFWTKIKIDNLGITQF